MCDVLSSIFDIDLDEFRPSMEPTEGKGPDRGAFLHHFLQMEDDMKTKTNSPLEPIKFLLTIHKNVGMISGRRDRNPFRQREGGAPS